MMIQSNQTYHRNSLQLQSPSLCHHWHCFDCLLEQPHLLVCLKVDNLVIIQSYLLLRRKEENCDKRGASISVSQFKSVTPCCQCTKAADTLPLELDSMSSPGIDFGILLATLAPGFPDAEAIISLKLSVSELWVIFDLRREFFSLSIFLRS